MTLINVKAEDYGIEETKAKDVRQTFEPMLKKMEELEDNFNDIIARHITPEVCAEARALRLEYVKTRTGTAKIHKALKDFYLKGGRFVDGFKNAQLMAAQGKEEKLKEIEDYYEEIARKEKEALQAQRAELLKPFKLMFEPPELGEMQAEAWEVFLAGVKAQHEAKLKAEAEAEAKRLEAEEEARLKAEAERKAEAEAKAAAEKKRKALEAKLRKEKKAAEAKLEALRKEQEAERLRLQAQQKKAAEAAKIAQEKKDRELAEARAEAEKLKEAARLKAEKEEAARKVKEEALEAELKKGDAAKFEDLLNDIKELKTKYTFTSKVNKAKYQAAGLLFDKIVTYLTKQ